MCVCPDTDIQKPTKKTGYEQQASYCHGPYNVCGLTCCVYPRKKIVIPVHFMFFLPELHHTHTHSPSQFLLEECRSLYSQFSWKVVPPFPYCHKGETAPGKFLPLLTFHGITSSSSSSSSSSLVSPDERWGGGREGGREEEKTFLFALAKKRQKKERVEKERVVSLFGPKLFSA